MKKIKWFGVAQEFDKEWKCWVALVIIILLAIVAGS
jgi:hypothetical protein